mmetsp:Transcript_44007/g.86875  ORF Transcript_44007/g.86875 Transcript_44007/m.86875 type:complete len:119 (-) Transcript_44007:299-655(-)
MNLVGQAGGSRLSVYLDSEIGQRSWHQQEEDQKGEKKAYKKDRWRRALRLPVYRQVLSSNPSFCNRKWRREGTGLDTGGDCPWMKPPKKHQRRQQPTPPPLPLVLGHVLVAPQGFLFY